MAPTKSKMKKKELLSEHPDRKKRGGWTDGRTDGWTDGRTDRQTLLQICVDATKKERKVEELNPYLHDDDSGHVWRPTSDPQRACIGEGESGR